MPISTWTFFGLLSGLRHFTASIWLGLTSIPQLVIKYPKNLLAPTLKAHLSALRRNLSSLSIWVSMLTYLFLIILEFSVRSIVNEAKIDVRFGINWFRYTYMLAHIHHILLIALALWLERIFISEMRLLSNTFLSFSNFTVNFRKSSWNLYSY